VAEMVEVVASATEMVEVVSSGVATGVPASVRALALIESSASAEGGALRPAIGADDAEPSLALTGSVARCAAKCDGSDCEAPMRGRAGVMPRGVS
jgi:hypothetical protein